MIVTASVEIDTAKLWQADVVKGHKYISDLVHALQDRLIEHRQGYFSRQEKDFPPCPKDSPPCPPNDEKKSPVEAQNASTNSTGHTNMIQIQVPKQHRNATIRVEINPLTNQPELYYTYQDSSHLLWGVRFRPEPRERCGPSYDAEAAPATFFQGDSY